MLTLKLLFFVYFCMSMTNCVDPERSSKNCKPFDKSVKIKQHTFTMRGVYVMLRGMPPHLQLSEFNTKNNGTLKILEIGCGNGHALLEVQAILPNSECVCVNKDGYGLEQVTNASSLISLINYHKIKVPCDASGNFVIPEVKLIDGIQKAPLPFPLDSFDLILSQHALNAGKLHSYQAKYAITSIVPLLKVGGTASLMLLEGRHGDLNMFLNPTLKQPMIINKLGFRPIILRTIKFTEFNKIFTILLYARRIVEKLPVYIGLYIKRCADEYSLRKLRQLSNIQYGNLTRNHIKREWGCMEVYPRSRQTFMNYTEDLLLFDNILSHIPKPLPLVQSENINLRLNIIQYNADYFSNIVSFLGDSSGKMS